MIKRLEQFDRDLFLTLNGFHADWLDPVMWYLSSILLMIPVFAFVMFKAYRYKGVNLVIFLFFGLAFCVLLSDRISVELFKEVFQRYRPTHNLEIGDLVHTIIKPFSTDEYRGGTFSFVSSHATNAFSLATFVFLSLRSFNKKWALMFFWAALVSYTRIYLGVHYPADLVCGGILGGVIGLIVYWAAKKLTQYITNKKAITAHE